MRDAKSDSLLSGPPTGSAKDASSNRNQHNKMQNYCKTIGALAAASALVAGNASAEVEYEMHAGYSSEYLWRGIDLGDNLAEVGLDVATEYEGWGLSAGMWAAAYDASATTGNQVDNEIDFYGEVSRDLGWATLSMGYIYYWQMGALGVDDQEIYFGASRDFGWATLSFTYFWDLAENQSTRPTPINGTGGNNGYTETSLSRSWELNPCLTLNTSTALGFLLEGWNAVHWTTKASLDWGFTENAKLSPYLAVSIELDDEDRTQWSEMGNEFVAGCMLSVGF
jgi:hypothetical protein